MSAELVLGTLIRTLNPYTGGKPGSMWFGRYRGETSPEATGVDFSEVNLEVVPGPTEWVFKDQPVQISRSIRVQCRWLTDETQKLLMTDYLLIGYEGETVSEDEPHRTAATSGMINRGLLYFLSDDRIFPLLGLLLIAAFAWLSSTWVSSALSRAEAVDVAQFEMYSLVSNLKGFSGRLAAASDDLAEGIGTLGQEIAAVGDEGTKEKLERWFSPASRSANRVHQISMDIERSFQNERLGSLSEKYGEQYLTTIPNLITPAFAQTSRAQQRQRSSGLSTTPDQRRMYEETFQKRDKIQLFQNGFFVLAGLGGVLLITLYFVPPPTKQTLAEIAKMYVPALITSWGTFMAGVSI